MSFFFHRKMSALQEELLQKAKSLKRAPPPKVPGPVVNGSKPEPQIPGVFDIKSVHLKKTGFRKSLIEADFPGLKEHGEKESNELNSLLAKRKAKFEATPEEDEKPKIKPKPMPKPRARTLSKGEKESEEMSSEKVDDIIQDVNENRLSSTDKMKPLPTLQKIGSKPPQKAPKPSNLKEHLARYSERNIVRCPRVLPVQPESSENGDSADIEGV